MAEEQASPGRRRRERVDEDGDLPPDQRVRVAVRIRPHNRADHGDTTSCLKVEGRRISADNGQKSQSFTFDHVFHKSTQEEVYLAIGEQMLHDAFSGYNSTIFAYGQTGSGKTHSMLGVEDDPVHEGLLPRLCKELFELSQELMAEDPTLVMKIQVSFVEAYNERIRDLLQFEGNHETPGELRDLKLKEDKKSHSFIVDGLSMHTVMNYSRVKSLIDAGTALRTKAETGMNELSSRSHSVFTIYLSQTHEPSRPGVKDTESKVTVVDLAGSERQSKTDVTSAVQAAEAEKINMSLLVLGRCLSACSSVGGSKHIPIRESVLTKMLMDIFGGNSRTTMFAAVSPSLFNFSETLSTLQYAHNAKKIKHQAKQNTVAKAAEIKELKEQVKALGRTLIEELEKAGQQKDALAAEVDTVIQERESLANALAETRAENQTLREQLAQLREEVTRLREQGPPPSVGVPTAAGPGPPAGPSAGLFGTVVQPGTLPMATGMVPAPEEHVEEEDEEEDETERREKLRIIQAELATKLTVPGSNWHTAHPPIPTSSAQPLATATELRTFVGHLAAVYACSFSPTGEKMVSASRDRTLKVWSVPTGTELVTLKGHTGFVLCCAFAPNGRDVVSASDDKTVKVWDTEAGKKLATLKGHNDKVYCACYSPSGVEIASCCSDKTIKVWNVDSAKKLVTLRGHDSAVFGVCFSHNGKRLVSGSDDKTVRLWDWLTGAQLCCLQGHAGTVWSCVFSPSDDTVLSSSMDGSLKLWDVETRVCVRTYRGHTAPVHHAVFARDGVTLVSASRDRSLKVWDTESGKTLVTLLGHTNTVYRCDVHSNLILSCSSDESLKVWNLKVH